MYGPPEATNPVGDLFNLTDQVAFITGASQGIGFATAEILGAAGASLVLVARRERQLSQAADVLRSRGFPVMDAASDVGDPRQINAVIDQARREFGRIDILVNNAGIAASGRIDDLTIDSWDELLKINLRGAFICSKAIVPMMREYGQGVIVNMASISGQTGGLSASLHYAASKGGLISFTKALARQMAPWGRANAIAPGQIDTSMGSRNQQQVQRVEEITPLARLGTPAEVAAGVFFLVSPASSYITGHVLNINGGLLL